MKNFFISIIFIFLLSSCASIQEIHPICENRVDSYICQVFPNPLAVDLILRFANVEAIKNDVYTKEQAVAAINNLETLIKNSHSFLDFFLIAQNYVGNMGPEIFILADSFSSFNRPIPISEFDKYLLLEHLNRQKQIILLIN